MNTPTQKPNQEPINQSDKKPSAQESVEMMELQKYIKELEERVAGLSRQTESLRAEVDEANYWVYDHGSVKQEL